MVSGLGARGPEAGKDFAPYYAPNYTHFRCRPEPWVVFVGGCATGLLIDDPAAAPKRRTYDVDVIAEIGSYAEYTVFSERLRALGFKENSREGAPLCRWTHGALTLDVSAWFAQFASSPNCRLQFANRSHGVSAHRSMRGKVACKQ